MATKRLYYFLRSADGAYLQAKLNTANGQWSFWLDGRRAWSPCFASADDTAVEQYRAAAAPIVGALELRPEVV